MVLVLYHLCNTPEEGS